jgi:hypothetical protein
MKLLTALAGLALASGAFAQSNRNPDNSVTIKSPRLMRGSEQLKIARVSYVGACKLFGFDNALTSDISYNSSSERSAVLDSNGRYTNLTNEYYTITSLTCYKNSEIKPYASVASNITRNADGSFTISEPRLLRGSAQLKIARISAKGTCKLFGLEDFIDSDFRTSSSAVMSANIDSNGFFSNLTTDYYSITSISCFNPASYNHVGAANGVIFYYNGNVDKIDFANAGFDLVKAE